MTVIYSSTYQNFDHENIDIWHKKIIYIVEISETTPRYASCSSKS